MDKPKPKCIQKFKDRFMLMGYDIWQQVTMQCLHKSRTYDVNNGSNRSCNCTELKHIVYIDWPFAIVNIIIYIEIILWWTENKSQLWGYSFLEAKATTHISLLHYFLFIVLYIAFIITYIWIVASQCSHRQPVTVAAFVAIAATAVVIDRALLPFYVVPSYRSINSGWSV